MLKVETHYKKRKKVKIDELTSAFCLAYWRSTVDVAGFGLGNFGISGWTLWWTGYSLEETRAPFVGAGHLFLIHCRNMRETGCIYEQNDEQTFAAKDIHDVS